MKAKTKTIFLSALAVLDCAFGGIIITTSNIKSSHENDIKVMASANYVIEKNDSNIEQVLNEVLIKQSELVSQESENNQPFLQDKVISNMVNVTVNTQLPKITNVSNSNKTSNVVSNTTSNASAKSITTTKTSNTTSNQTSNSSAIVYDGMTLDQLSTKLNKSLKGELSGKGYLIASYSLQKKVDPYVATAIMLHETGCASGSCSQLMKKCNNVGGMVGKGCNGFSYFESLDTGIKKFIDNLYKNYYAVGLNTPAKMNSKYASDKSWSKRVNTFVNQIKSK